MKKIIISLVLAMAVVYLIGGCNNVGIGLTGSSNALVKNQLGLIHSRSVKEWTVCDGVTDDSKGLAKAFAAAKNGAFTLEINCPLYFHVGMDIARPIFIDSDTSVNFSESGLIIVDNVLIPSFVIANSSNINLSNWRVKYVGGIPIDERTGGYYNDGTWIPANERDPAGVFFGLYTLKYWLLKNRNISMVRTIPPLGTGFLDPAAIFYLKGNTSNVKINNMTLFVDDSTTADKFMPIAFALCPGETDNQTLVEPAPLSKPYIEVPHDITFENISLDGYYFGWHGSGQNITIKGIKSLRYSDLQDGNGENIGGMGGWFPPPHLFYFNTQPNWDHSLDNDSFLIDNVVDSGVRLGLARDKGKGAPISGHALSLKIQANNSLVDNYTSFRPDGFMDVLPSSNLTVKNVTASYDSSFLNYTLPMLRFVQQGHHNIRFENISLTDDAFFTYIDPLYGSDGESNTNIVFVNTKVKINHWGEPNPPMYSQIVKGTLPYFGGTGHSFDLYTTFSGMIQNAAITVSNPESVSYGNNTLRNVPVGSFGLRTYIIENNTTTQNLYNVMIQTGLNLPFGLEYDTSRSSCDLTKEGVSLAPKQNCKLVYKYQPTTKGINSYFVLKLYAHDALFNIVTSDDIYVPYSSRY
ncbi:MAG: hypothetical protein K2Q03_09770 [Sphingobacteriaceae bacterium]|nr:hypothetical protein [Sphingobacteriaceae bacterium]